MTGIALVASIPYDWLTSGKVLAPTLYRLSSVGYHTLRFINAGNTVPLFCSERVVEIPWAFKVIRQLPRSARVLEVGNVLGPNLARMGFMVDTIDTSVGPRPKERGWNLNRLDICGFTAVDTYDGAVSISTIEHVGLGHYEDPVEPEGDKKALKRIGDALKPGGRIFISVPFSTYARTTWQRTYDASSLQSLFQDFSEVKMQVFSFDKFRWRPGPPPALQGSTKPPHTQLPVTSVALVEAVKPV